MKVVFDQLSAKASKLVTHEYSTSFSLATKMLGKSIRQDIYNIYGFVRLADEIVDSFQEYNRRELFDDFENQLYEALSRRISLNPILNSFQETFHKHNISLEFVKSFMKSMRSDLGVIAFQTKEEYGSYIYGSADVVGLMCLQVFVKGNKAQFEELKEFAMRLGSAFQKVNFLRDLQQDFEDLGRSYFPNTNLEDLDEWSKKEIIDNIEADFQMGIQGIRKLPIEARFGVYAAYRYYRQLLKKLEKTPASKIRSTRIRVPNYKKMELLTRSYINYQLNLM